MRVLTFGSCCSLDTDIMSPFSLFTNAKEVKSPPGNIIEDEELLVGNDTNGSDNELSAPLLSHSGETKMGRFSSWKVGALILFAVTASVLCMATGQGWKASSAPVTNSFVSKEPQYWTKCAFKRQRCNPGYWPVQTVNCKFGRKKTCVN